MYDHNNLTPNERRLLTALLVLVGVIELLALLL